MSGTVIFRADAAPEMGAGHVMRCFTLGAAFVRAGWLATLAHRAGSLEVMPRSDPPEVATWLVEDGDEAEQLVRHWPSGADLLVVDHYGLAASFERACRPWAKRVLVIDDLPNRMHDCDTLVNPAPGGTLTEGNVPACCDVLAGPAYAPIDRTIGHLRRSALTRRNAGGPAQRLLVSLGATDPDNVTSRVLKAISITGLPLKIDVVLGAGAPHLESVRAEIEGLGRDVKLHVNTRDMAFLMASADLAVGAGGTSVWERCCLGLPTILVVIAENQTANAVALEQAGAVRVAKPEQVGTVLAKLAGDAAARGAMSRSAASLCDGLGADRIVAAIDPPRSRAGGIVRLRPAELEDEAIMLAWQRLPGARQYARDTRVPTGAEHHRWFRARLGNPDCLLNVVLHDGVPAGVLRLDRLNEDAFEISILIAPEMQGQGVGFGTLRLARALVPDARLVAEVLPSNEASRALFSAAGYIPKNGGFVHESGCGSQQRERTAGA